MRRYYRFLISSINNILKKILILLTTSFIKLLNKKLVRHTKEYIIYTRLKILISVKWRSAFDSDQVIDIDNFFIF